MSEVNIIKKICKNYNFTYKQLSERIGYSEGAIKTAVSSGKISSPLETAIILWVENHSLKKELSEEKEKIKVFKQAVKGFFME